MLRRSLPWLALSLLTATACFAEPETDPGAADSGNNSTSGGDSEASEAQSGADTTASTGAESSGADETSGGADDTTSGDDAGYSQDVLDHLDLPFPLDNYADVDLPDHFLTPAVTQLDNTPPGNAITDAGATLGRVLFYDTALSANDTVACASCHVQDLGFSDDRVLSEGFDGGLTGRHSMSLANARYYGPGHFFWDERADTLEDQVLLPIQDAVEMGMTIPGLIDAVSGQPYYAELFEAAFGDDDVTPERISGALAQFVRAMASYRSRYDEGIDMTGSITAPFPNFNEAENLGKQLFLGPQGNCAICHLGVQGAAPPPGQFPNTAIFQPVMALNNGLDADPQDPGAGGGRFKSPSLRNSEWSGPYMHDGRFDTLEQVVDHYDSGVQMSPGLDPRLMPNGQPQQLNLTDAEKAAIVAFLRTLSDAPLRQDARFADPFRQGA